MIDAEPRVPEHAGGNRDAGADEHLARSGGLIAERHHHRERHGEIVGIALLETEWTGRKAEPVLKDPGAHDGDGAHDRDGNGGGEDRTRLHQAAGQRTYAVVLETGEEVMASLQKFVEEENILAAQFTAIGAFSDAVLMYFDWAKKNYLKIPVREQVEVASLLGDVAEAP